MKIGRFGRGNGDFYVAEARKQKDGTVKVEVIETSKDFEYLAIKYGFISDESEQDDSDILEDIYPEWKKITSQSFEVYVCEASLFPHLAYMQPRF